MGRGENCFVMLLSGIHKTGPPNHNANLPLKGFLYVNGKSGQEVNGKSGHSDHWNKIPDSVLHDKRLSTSARCVYAVLAGSCHHGNKVTLGQRRIAGLLGIHQETVGVALEELKRVGHIKIDGERQSRRVYTLLHSAFSATWESSSKPIAVNRKFKPGVFCPTCHKLRPGLLRSVPHHSRRRAVHASEDHIHPAGTAPQ